MEVEALVEALLRDVLFYQHSGGGVTLSGGEPTMFMEYAGRVAAGLRRHGVNVLLETCGHFVWQSFTQHLLPHLSAVYFDLKLVDPEEHRARAGPSNRIILANLRRLAARASHEDGLELLPRVPLVPGITDGEQNLQGIADLLIHLSLHRVAFLPYNPLWVAKQRAMNLDLPYGHEEWMSLEQIAACAAIFEEAGVQVV